ncbi:MAG: beta-aspartyl-peptidase [Firmicutes bacterium]|jgi:beta-aspartyl-dipeptidase (metallo-type)|nr:beta-aspartyl-peptidase [Bacillota bacterium]MCL5064796.1 beta-aspartyl-peptidase [Bacillota bacterium]
MTVTAVLVRGAQVFAPEPLGLVDVLSVGERIVAIGSELELPSWADGVELDGRGALLMPGLIDQHVHIAGGGGEGGPQNRTPEIRLTDLTTAGITTVVGVLGTDGTTRSVAELLAKARALEYEGITAWIYTGAYDVPTRTVTGSARRDIVLLDRVLGVGEVALSDQRGSHPSPQALAELATEARVGGLLSGKAGVLHLHLGSGRRHLQALIELVDQHDIPIDTFVPTHLNRARGLLADAVQYGKRGGWLDITSGIVPDAEDREAVDPAEALIDLSRQGIAWEHLSMSSDAQGSAPKFDAQGALTGMGIGRADSLWQAVRRLVTDHALTWSEALRPVTTTPARILKLANVGRVAVGWQADFLLVRDREIESVIARGQWMVGQGKPKRFGTFENGKSP